MLFDVGRRYPRAYVHRYKKRPRPEGFGQEGPAEMHYLLSRLEQHLSGAEPSSEPYRNPWNGPMTATYINKIIYETRGHGAADNHFSGDNVLHFAGELGYGLTITNRRDRFPKQLKAHLHHDKTKPGCPKAKAARYENPIVAISQVAATETTKAYTKTLVSFQSTGATNICGVNNLPSCSLYVTTKSRGSGLTKRTWGIEQNEGRQIYLGQYFAVDNVDHMVQLAMIRYITWKYWHAPFLHGLSICVVAAYDMYIECCEGELDSDWFVDEKSRMSFREFRLTLSEQMLKYDPKNRSLPGDEFFRAWTRRPKRARSSASAQSSAVTLDSSSGLCADNFKKAKTATRTKPPPRLCGNLQHIKAHLATVECKTNMAPCEVCGEKTSWKCTTCDKYICVLSKARWSGSQCLMTYHDDSFFGLSCSDKKEIHGKKKKDWVPPTHRQILLNANRINTLKREMDDVLM